MKTKKKEGTKRSTCDTCRLESKGVISMEAYEQSAAPATVHLTTLVFVHSALSSFTKRERCFSSFSHPNSHSLPFKSSQPQLTSYLHNNTLPYPSPPPSALLLLPLPSPPSPSLASPFFLSTLIICGVGGKNAPTDRVTSATICQLPQSSLYIACVSLSLPPRHPFFFLLS
ncbi:hypothetical protein BC939DRAFT_32322 [Gamsiella multidivaricata]|uniref:uncharacterized protein n=1 Tax=Gamsiella multidivaricata TaxID=101098 RepID=UPI0022212350|nr:uncharacterized protein BC939DRAFT_32322 [Gamsiella multidivaricata]KAI7816747.1 hypothetical protein BC939DRAFT_32322 [Gamsiella multidivaricata]